MRVQSRCTHSAKNDPHNAWESDVGIAAGVPATTTLFSNLQFYPLSFIA